MADSYDVQITGVSQKGSCGAGHKVGDKWIVGGTTPSGICNEAYHMLYPNLRNYKFGGILPWTQDQDSTQVCCNDPINPVVFELKRIRK